ncbi:MAG: hypothetical protein ACE5HH_01245 [Candidatus Hydrothermarchaeales archaeon]
MDLPKTAVNSSLILLVIFILLGSPTFAAEVHQEYDWWEPSLKSNELSKEFLSCAACHETLGVAGGAHPSFRKYCEDCHLLGRSGPFVFYRAANLYRNFNYSAPMVYYHIINASDSKIYYKYTADFIEIPDQSDRFNGASQSSCFGWNQETGQGTCHGISSENPVDGYFAFNLTKNSTREDPYRYAVEAEHLPDTTDCLYCHRQSDSAIAAAWGDPTQVDTSHFEAGENSQCYECHVQGGITLTTFHIMGPEPEVIYLEPPETTPPPPTTPPPETVPPETTPPPTTTPPTTHPPTTLPPTTSPPTTLPPETTQPPTVTPPPTKPPFFAGVSPLYVGIGVIVLLLLIAAISYFVKIKSKKGQDK